MPEIRHPSYQMQRSRSYELDIRRSSHLWDSLEQQEASTTLDAVLALQTLVLLT